MNSYALICSNENSLMEKPLYNMLAHFNRNTTFFLYEHSFLDRAHLETLEIDWLTAQVGVRRIHSYMSEGENSKLRFFAESIPLNMWIGDFDYFLGFSEVQARVLLENWSHISIVEESP